MKRKQFIRSCGYGCLGLLGMGISLQSCVSAKAVQGRIDKDELVIPLIALEKNYLVVENSLLQYPICIYKRNENEYTALWMRCTHRGATLQVFGDKLQCPAHGSEFTNFGKVASGPANLGLRTFPVTVRDQELRISIRAV